MGLAGWFLWGCLAVSVVLSLIGVRLGSYRSLLVAAALSLLFGTATFFSIGKCVWLLLFAPQLGIAVALYRQARASDTTEG